MYSAHFLENMFHSRELNKPKQIMKKNPIADID
jgi:hypothetical protein